MTHHTNTLDTTLKVISIISTAGLLVVLALTLTTMWATGRSMERAACYRTATAAEQCGTPNLLERLLSRVYRPQT